MWKTFDVQSIRPLQCAFFKSNRYLVYVVLRLQIYVVGGEFLERF